MNSCDICLAAMKRDLPTAPLCPWRIADKVWERLHIDFAGFEKTFYLIIVCSKSKWLDVIEMPNITTARTIKELRTKFAAYWLPDIVVYDNGDHNLRVRSLNNFCLEMVSSIFW